jgi:hypothetical protein
MVLPRDLQRPAFAAHASLAFAATGVACPPSLGPGNRRGFSTTAPAAQDAFHRLDARPCDRVERFRVYVSVCAYSLRTLSPDAMKLPSSRNELPRRATPRLRGLPLGSPRSSEEKMLLTDFCNRHTTRALVDRSISGHEAFAVTDRYRASLRLTRRCASTPLAIAAPCCFAATRPQIGVRLTAYTELWLRRSQPRPHFWGGPSTTPGGAPVPRFYRPHARLTADASDTPCRAPRVPGKTRASFEEPGPLRPTARQRERLNPAQSVFHRQCAPKKKSAFAKNSLGREPATGPPALPPGPGFRRFFATRNALAPSG